VIENIIFEIFVISMVIAGSLVYFIGFVKTCFQYKIFGLSIIASFSHNPVLQGITGNYLGFGISIPTLIAITILLNSFPYSSTKHYPLILFKQSGVLIALLLIYVSVTTIFANDIVNSTKSTVSLFVIFLAGWLQFGKVSNLSDNPRAIILSICQGIGFSSFVTIMFMLIVVGPIAYLGLIGGLNSQLNILGFGVSRLQYAGFNATGVSIAAVFSIFWLHSLLNTKYFKESTVKKLIVLLLIVISLVVLFWSGSRGPIIAFSTTVIFLFFRVLISKRINVSKMVKVSMIAVAVIVLSISFLQDNFKRSRIKAHGNDLGVIEVFIQDRIAYNGQLAFEYISNAGFFGYGYGFLSAGGDVNKVNLESYPLKAYVELGFIGAFLHILVFLILSSHVIKADKIASKITNKNDYLPSSIIVFTWLNSIASFGFMLHVGANILLVGLMSSSLVYVFKTYNGSNIGTSNKL
jgi:hypothetical protein